MENWKSNKKFDITVCMGSACFARGNAQNLEFIENFIAQNGLDAKIELSGSRCEGKCADGPNIIINGVEHRCVDEEKIKSVFESVMSELNE